MEHMHYLYFKLKGKQVSTLNSKVPLSHRQIFYFVDLLVGAGRLEADDTFSTKKNNNQLAAEHSRQNTPQCPLALIKCFCLCQRTCSIWMQRGNVVEQTRFVISSVCGYILVAMHGGCLSQVILWLWTILEQQVILTTFQQCRGVNSCFALCLRPPFPSVFMLRENSLLIGLASFLI